ncbi:hypothetical protein H5V45_17090 [Nocardioides sp. KIGAM211]|uniref:Uncharacterized protein n=1 Tax=Nocardioides luti TaxID=2761101 RepID=A0A7X0RKS1_9ACTN|nr:DUF6758 family protein [Nocardioides luti]MBB6629045.1 hypothetical protein [Nocardioides luti]
MSLAAGCPRCTFPVLDDEAGSGWACPAHGPIRPLWRPQEVGYEDFTAHLRAAPDFPTYLPWPMGPAWSVSDFALVGDGERLTAGTLTCTSGTSEQDGPVDVLVVTEEAGTGLGARCARTAYDDPGGEIRDGVPALRIRVEGQVVPLWSVSTSAADGEFDRSVLAGEAHGRWLWVVLRPASAVLMLGDDWILRDVSRLGPELVETVFGGPAPAW